MRKTISFESRGSQCSGWLYVPDGLGTNKAPAVVMAHGLSAVKEQALPGYARQFAAAGFATLVFDYRCFGASEGEPAANCFRWRWLRTTATRSPGYPTSLKSTRRGSASGEHPSAAATCSTSDRSTGASRRWSPRCPMWPPGVPAHTVAGEVGKRRPGDHRGPPRTLSNRGGELC